MARTFREVWRWLIPRWLGVPDDPDDEGARVTHTITLMMDATLERARQGLDARFPTRTGESANALTAADRGLPRGRSETAAAHAERMKSWRTPRTHRVRGNAFELLTQVWTYWGGIDAGTIDANGRRYSITEAGVSTKEAPIDWDWDGTTTPGTSTWARFWITLAPSDAFGIEETPDFGDDALWGGAIGTPGYTLGQTGVTPADVLAMRNLFQQGAWHPEHARPEWVILAPDTLEIDPDGTYLHWSRNVAGVQTPARSNHYRYWSLSPTLNNVYPGDPDSFAEETYLVEGTTGPTYGGDPDNAAAWDPIVLPDGAEYLGDHTSFPADVLLLDDGSTP